MSLSEYLRTPLARARTGGLRLGDTAAEPYELEDLEVAYLLRRSVLRGGPDDVALTNAVKTVTYGDEAGDEGGSVSGLTAEMSLSRQALRASNVEIATGQQILMRVRYRNRWYDEWQMMVTVGEDASGGDDLSVTLNDPFAAIRHRRADFVFRKGKKRRKKGWYAHEAVRYAAERLGVPLGPLARGKTRITTAPKDLKDADLVAVALAVYDKERKETGREFFVRFRNGKFSVQAGSEQLQGVSPSLSKALIITGAAQAFSVTTEWADPAEENAGTAIPYTVIKASSKVGRGKEEKVIRARVSASTAVRNRFGTVVKAKEYERVKTRQELRDRARRDLAEVLATKRTATATIQYVPFLRRGQPVVCRVADFGNRDNIAFIQSYSHTLDGAGRTTTLTLTEQDVYLQMLDDREEEERKKKEKKRKNAKRARKK